MRLNWSTSLLSGYKSKRMNWLAGCLVLARFWLGRGSSWSWSPIMVPGFSYAGMGNVANDGSRTYTYDAEGRPVTAAGVQTTLSPLDALWSRIADFWGS